MNEYEMEGALVIDGLTLAETVGDGDIVPINKNSFTYRVGMKTVKDYMIGGEERARIQKENGLSAAISEVNTAIRGILNHHVKMPVWDEENYVLTLTAENGQSLVIDLPLESLAKGMDYDPKTKEIVLTKQNGSKIRVSVSDLIDIYTGSLGEHIQITVEDNVIKATLLKGSVSEEYLTATLLEKIEGKAEQSDLEEEARLREEGDQHLQEQINELTPEGMEGLSERLAELEKLAPGNDSDPPVGTSYWQGPNDQPPNARYPGTAWKDWTRMAEVYELIPECVYINLFEKEDPPYWTEADDIWEGEYRIWALGGMSTVGTRRILQCVREVYDQDPREMNLLDWEDLPDITRVPRSALQDWSAPDLAIGAGVTHNGDSYRVVGVLTWEGLYPSFEGGNRPTFISGGIKGEDWHELTVEEMPEHDHTVGIGIMGKDAVYYLPMLGMNFTNNVDAMKTSSAGNNYPHNNAPPTISLKLLRRIS
jgi:hypothetical protein